MARPRKRPAPLPIPEPVEIAGGLLEIPTERILPNPDQPRSDFDPAELEHLAQSIRENGIIQPLVVEPAPGGMYILHAGERRTRAARLAGLAAVPAVVVAPLNGSGHEDRLVRALVENLQRADMNPIDEARGYQKLLELGYTITAVAHKLGVSSARVSARLDWLALEPEIQGLVAQGRLSKDPQAAAALKSIPAPAERIGLAKKMAENRSTVKGIVQICKNYNAARAERAINPDETPALRIAESRGHKAFSRSRWDAFAQVGKVPPWPLVEIAARDTCKHCSLRDIASPTTCKECPLVEMLAQMIGRTQ